MKAARHGFFGHSVFSKIIHVIILTGFLLFVLVGLFFQLHFSSRIKSQYDTALKHYCGYLAVDLKSPVDTLYAKKIAAESGLNITYVKENKIWTTNETSGHESGFLRRFLGSMIDDDRFEYKLPDGSMYIFTSNFYKMIHPNGREFIILDVGILLIMLLTHRLLKRILNPIRKLDEGVKQISSGNFDFEIEIKGKDELAVLSDSFNKMKCRIAGMIKAREQLLMDVSHELRSPLTRVKLALEFMEDGKTRSSITDDIREMEIMITELLETERLANAKGGLQLVETDLIELLKNISRNYKHPHPGVEFHTATESLNIRLDPERIRTAVSNILENAIKYSHSGSAAVKVSLTKGSDSAVISIKDDGIGIPADDLPYIFEPFYRSDRSRSKSIKGYGLGLNLCKKIIEAHAGNINIANNPDRGVTVTITLPYTGV